ncbi:MAG: hypothetical protein ABI641_12125 [Caldimonas sp.]
MAEPIRMALLWRCASEPDPALSTVCYALNKQLRQLQTAWGIDARIEAATPDGDDDSVYRIYVSDDPRKFAAELSGLTGAHRQIGNKVLAIVQLTDHWTRTVSHEMLETARNPKLDQWVRHPSPIAGQGEVDYFVEICDPCQATTYAIDGIEVCEFCTPEYFDDRSPPGSRLTANNLAERPFQVLDGGIQRWRVPKAGGGFEIYSTEEGAVGDYDGGANRAPLYRNRQDILHYRPTSTAG